jgi:hypothetical protein
MRAFVASLTVSLLTVASIAAQDARADALVDRLTAYILAYELQISSVVAEETYVQTLIRPRRMPGPDERRTLVSDFSFARLPGGQAWLGYRDTYLVDGMQVRSPDRRLDRLLADDTDAAFDEALRISRENARYNLGNDDIVARTINVPLFTLDLMHPRYRARFAFEAGGQETLIGHRVRRLDFSERVRPSIIRTPSGGENVAGGSIWMDEATGEVWRTQLRLREAISSLRLTVDFARNADVAMVVPVRMVENYARPDGIALGGTATYAKFRRFQTGGRILPSR